MTTEITKRPQSIDWIAIRSDNHYRRVFQIPEEEAIRYMENIITQAFQYKGQKANATDVSYIAVNVLAEINRDSHLRHLKMAEVKDAVLRGVTGRLAMFGINVASVVSTLSIYYNDFIPARNIEANRRREQAEQDKQARLFDGHEEQRDHLVNQITTNFKRIN